MRARPRDLSKIPPGTMLQAKLVTGASNGPVREEVISALTINGETFIEERAMLIGSGTSTENRLFVKFGQVVFRDGTVSSIDGHACDLSDKIVGLKGNFLGNKAAQFAGGVGLGFMGGMSEGLQETEGQQGVVIKKSNIKNALLNAAGKTALEQSHNMMSDLKNQVPVIEVPEGKEICVIVSNQPS